MRCILIIAVVLGLSAAPGAGPALADSSGHIAKCSSKVVAGVEEDTCVPNPNANITRDVPGVDVELEGGLGVGLG